MSRDRQPPQLMLPGQAAAPDGPCDLNAMYVLHHAFRRDLERFGRAASATPIGATSTWGALLQRWDRFAHLLHDHHAKEDDVLWPLLRGRLDAAGDASGLAVLDAMQAEHALIDPLLDEIRSLLVALAMPPGSTITAPPISAPSDPAVRDRVAALSVQRSALCAALERAATVLDDHLGHEERDAVAVMQRYIDGEEWSRLEKKELAGRPTIGEVLYLLPWVADGLTAPVLSFMLHQAGPMFRIARRVGMRRFLRLDERAFAYAGPALG